VNKRLLEHEKRAILIRLPVALALMLVSSWSIAFPYLGFNSDTAIFGVMGKDLLAHNYFPIFLYGQKYLFSFTSHLVAGFLALGLDEILALRLSAVLVSVAGIWLFFEALLRYLPEREIGLPVSTSVMCLVVASPPFVGLIFQPSGQDWTIFLTGAGLWFVARQKEHTASAANWVALGYFCAYTFFCRPQILLLIVPALLGALRGLVLRKVSLLCFLGGLFFGYLPVLFHIVFRAHDWPIVHYTPALILGRFEDFSRQGRLLFGEIIPILFSIESFDRWALGGIVFLGVVGFSVLRNEDLPTAGLILGSGVTLALLVGIDKLTVDVASIRYCLPFYLVAIWITWVRASQQPSLVRPLVLISFAMLLSSIPKWVDFTWECVAYQKDHISLENRLLVELPRDGVVFADYWESYAWGYVLDDQVALEAYPFHAVRRMGRWTALIGTRPSYWLVDKEKKGSIWTELRRKGFEPEGWEMIKSFEGMGHTYELYKLTDIQTGRLLIERYIPVYLQTSYPPGGSLTH